MKITAIESASNPLLKKVRSLHERAGRDKLGLFILEGPKLLAEAKLKGVSIQDVIVSQSYLSSGFAKDDKLDLDAVTLVDDKLFAALYTTSSPCGIVSVGKIRSARLEDCLKGDRTLVAIAESVQDPGNLGTMIRSCLAFGATGLVATAGSVDAFNPKVVRSAMGALFSLPVITGLKIEELINRLRQAKIRIVALEPSVPKPFWLIEMKQPLAFLFGNEGNGLSLHASQQADELVTIPIADQTESLNVAVSSSLVLFECARQRSLDAVE